MASFTEIKKMDNMKISKDSKSSIKRSLKMIFQKMKLQFSCLNFSLKDKDKMIKMDPKNQMMNSLNKK